MLFFSNNTSPKHNENFGLPFLISKQNPKKLKIALKNLL